MSRFFLVVLMGVTSMGWAISAEDIVTIPFDKPVWSLGLSDASWLFPKTDRAKSVAILGLSVKYTGMPESEQEQKEDDIGRNSRSLPLYILERLFIESDIDPTNYLSCLKNLGPIVTGVRTPGKELHSQMERKFDYVITGSIEKNYLDLLTTITIYIYDSGKDSETVLATKSSLNQNTAVLAAEVGDLAVKRIREIAQSRPNPNVTRFPNPSAELRPYYLEGLGQLLMQTLAQNNFIPANSIWGEDDMLNWYKTLWAHEKGNNRIKVMYFKGIIASIEYGGEAHKGHSTDLKSFMMSSKDRSDIFLKLSPLLYKRLNDSKNFDLWSANESKDASSEYLGWIDRLKNEKPAKVSE